MQMKKIFLLVITLSPLFCLSQNNIDSCSITIFEESNNLPLSEVQVYTRQDIFLTNSMGIVSIPCDYSDTILIKRLGYETQTLELPTDKDTIFLKLNSLMFEPITVIGGIKPKKYKLGRKNSKYDYQVGLRGDSDLKLCSVIKNTSGKRMKLQEAYLFLTNRGSQENTITIDVYKNKGGHIGRPISMGINLVKKNRKKGWFQLDLEEKIVIPKEGIILLIKVNGISNENTFIGMIEYLESQNVDSYLVQPNGQLDQVPRPYSNRHFGIKFFAKIQ